MSAQGFNYERVRLDDKRLQERVSNDDEHRVAGDEKEATRAGTEPSDAEKDEYEDGWQVAPNEDEMVLMIFKHHSFGRSMGRLCIVHLLTCSSIRM